MKRTLLILSVAGLLLMAIPVAIFSATEAYPIIDSITPNTGRNTHAVHIHDLIGADFEEGATVRLVKFGELDIEALHLIVESPERISCDFDLTGASPGIWSVTVTNPDEESDTLTDAFTITSGRILSVPQDYFSIQRAIDAASHGDTVMVSPGTYYEQITMKEGMDVIALGTSEERYDFTTAEWTTIDASGADGGGGRCGGGMGGKNKRINTVRGADEATLDGFTIKGATGIPEQGPRVGGNGVLCVERKTLRGSSPTIQNCIITDNTRGVAAAYGAKPMIYHNKIYHNEHVGIGTMDTSTSPVILANEISWSKIAAGIGCDGSSPIIEKNKIHHNAMAGIGTKNGATPTISENEISGNALAGIGCDGSSPTITKNRIHHNKEAGIGSKNDANVVITQNDIYSNSAAGIGSEGANLEIRRNLIHHNHEAGIGCNPATGVITNNIVFENDAAGIALFATPMEVYNNTVAFNGTVGIVNNSGTEIPMKNNICYYNTGPGIESAPGDYSYNCLFGNNGVWEGGSDPWIYRPQYAGNDPGTEDIFPISDPLFVDAEGYDFHLKSGSPCIDAGDSDSAFNDPDRTRNDMGAYGGGEGPTLLPKLSLATLSCASDQIFSVGDPTTSINPITITDDGTTPVITAEDDIRITIPAGFNMVWDEGVTTTSVTGLGSSKVSTSVFYEDNGKMVVIDVATDFSPGDFITISDLKFTNFSSPSQIDHLELEVDNEGTIEDEDDKMMIIVKWVDYYVDAVNGSDLTDNGSPSCPWKTITYALSQVPSDPGSIIHVAPGNYDKTLGENFPLTMRDGVFLVGAGSETTILDATESNQSVIYCYDISWAGIEGLKITGGNHSSDGAGGGIYLERSSPTITNNSIVNNNACNTANWGEGAAGGIYCTYRSSPTISNNTVTDNNAENGADWGGAGGGIYCTYKSSPTIKNNTITGNSAGNTSGTESGAMGGSAGGGISCNYLSSPTITENTISGNNATNSHSAADQPEGGGAGGGISCSHRSSPTITGNTITSNAAENINKYGVAGGGIACFYRSNPTIMNNTITDNTGDDDSNSDGWGATGGGIGVSYESSPIIADNTISSNTAGTHDGGGGICVYYDSSPTITRNIISGNSGSASWNGAGGGISVHKRSSPTIVNNTITGNTALGSRGGGGISSCQRGYPTIINNTVAYNIATGYHSGGICRTYKGSATIINCIVWGNGDDLYGCDATYSDIEDGDAGTGNISADPKFVDPSGGDYHLQATSPCIDAGNPDPAFNDIKDPDNPEQAKWPSLGTTRNDMGAYGGPNPFTLY